MYYKTFLAFFFVLSFYSWSQEYEINSLYVEIDTEEGDLSLETEDRMTALVANLPIKRFLNKANNEDQQ